MTNEELAAAVQAGERDRLLELWEGVRRFAFQQAHRWYAAYQGGRGVALDDLEQTAFLALLDALEGYNAEAGAFIGWYAMRLKAAYSDAYGVRTRRDREDPLQNCASLDAPVGGDAEDLTLGDTIGEPDAALEGIDSEIWRDQLHAALVEAMCALPRNEQAVIHGKYFHGRALRDLGPDAVNAEKRAMNRLRRPETLRSLEQFIDDRTPFYAPAGIGVFQRTGSSVVELAVFQREDMRRRRNYPLEKLG